MNHLLRTAILVSCFCGGALHGAAAGPTIEVQVQAFEVQGGKDVLKEIASEENQRKTLSRDGVVALGDLRTATLSGKPSRVESVREMAFPTDFDANRHPTEFERRNVGLEFEVSPVAQEKGGPIALKVAVTYTKFLGFIEARADEPPPEGDALDALLLAEPKPGGIRQPIFATSRIVTEVVVMPGRPILIGGDKVYLLLTASETP